MRKKVKKRGRKIKKKKGKIQSLNILPVLFVITLLGLFSETVRTLPVGALSEFNKPNYYKVPKLNPQFTEDKYLKNKIAFEKKNTKDISEEIKIQKTEDKIVINEKIFVAEAIEDETNVLDIIIQSNQEKLKEVIKIKKIKKTQEKIKLAADTSTKTITINGEDKIIVGSSDKNITYMQILQKPNDLDLNLKYAQQQGKIGNYKQTISTLERLNMLYPDNIEIKLYLLSVLVQADAPDKALTVIDELKANEDMTPEDLATVKAIEEEMKERKRPKLWNFYADVGIGGVQNNNVNSVSKSNLQMSSDSLIAFNSAKYDRTYSGSLGLTATRSVGDASSFMINLAVTDSDQEEETGDDFESYGLTLAYDTSVGNQSLSPYFMLNKTDYQDDADSFALMYGIGGFFPVGESHSLSYGYSFSDSKGNNNTSDTTADDTNAIGHSFSLGHDFVISDLISFSTGLSFSDSDAKDDTNDFETYDLSFRINFAYPWAYISIGDAWSWNDYKRLDTSTNSGQIRSDYVHTLDFMITKAVGDFLPFIDPNKNLFANLSYEKSISEANIINYDYIADSFSLSFSKSFHLNK